MLLLIVTKKCFLGVLIINNTIKIEYLKVLPLSGSSDIPGSFKSLQLKYKGHELSGYFPDKATKFQISYMQIATMSIILLSSYQDSLKHLFLFHFGIIHSKFSTLFQKIFCNVFAGRFSRIPSVFLEGKTIQSNLFARDCVEECRYYSIGKPSFLEFVHFYDLKNNYRAQC